MVEIDISATVTNVRGRTVQQQGAGSGWIMDANGTIVTNNHVVQGATTITVTTSDGKTFPAQVINTDPCDRSGTDQDQRYATPEYENRRCLQTPERRLGTSHRQSIGRRHHRNARYSQSFRGQCAR